MKKILIMVVILSSILSTQGQESQTHKFVFDKYKYIMYKAKNGKFIKSYPEERENIQITISNGIFIFDNDNDYLELKIISYSHEKGKIICTLKDDDSDIKFEYDVSSYIGKMIFTSGKKIIVQKMYKTNPLH
jgi:hypothetical protein